MKQSITVSVPGKIHLLGEHIVVYGKPALLAAVDKRCKVNLSFQAEKKVTIISKKLKQEQSLSMDEVFIKASDARKKWEEFIETKDISYLTSLRASLLDYSFLAVAESLIPYRDTIRFGLRVEIESDIPLGAGCGSSAAIAVGISGAVEYLFTKKIDKDRIFETALRIEEYKHGTPSGGDIAAVLYGGFITFEKVDDKRKITPYKIKAKDFYLIDSGKPYESTGEMIEIVRTYKKENPQRAKKIFNKQGDLVEELLIACREKKSETIINIIKKGEENLEKLGVVSKSVALLIREIEKIDAAAKISGGGGRRAGTGMLLSYSKNKVKLEKICKNAMYPLLTIRLGGEGFTIEGKTT